MPEVSRFRAYGENAATFLIFRALAECRGGVAGAFLKHLRQFGTGKTNGWDEFSQTEIWLFPSFGKRDGFGEPDALVLADRHVFWIEVETVVDHVVRLHKLRGALVQLMRFHLFQTALAEQPGADRITGRTLTDTRKLRPAAVQVSGHGVLTELRDRLGEAGTAGTDHYVLLGIDHEPSHPNPLALGRALADEVTPLARAFPTDLPKLPTARCWYAFWKGDVESGLFTVNGSPFRLDEHHVSIRSRDAQRPR